MYKRKWTPSKTARREFAAKMDTITDFCNQNGITQCRDSYYFTLDGQEYRVSNHSVEASNAAAYNDLTGQTRELYHPEGREADVIYIHASKTRIIEIYSDLQHGYKLDGRGRRRE